MIFFFFKPLLLLMILQKKTEFFFYAYEYLFQFLGKHHYTSYIYISRYRIELKDAKNEFILAKNEFILNYRRLAAWH